MLWRVDVPTMNNNTLEFLSPEFFEFTRMFVDYMLIQRAITSIWLSATFHRALVFTNYPLSSASLPLDDLTLLNGGLSLSFLEGLDLSELLPVLKVLANLWLNFMNFRDQVVIDFWQLILQGLMLEQIGEEGFRVGKKFVKWTTLVSLWQDLLQSLVK